MILEVVRNGFEVVDAMGVVVEDDEDDDVARYNVDATKVGLVGRKVVGGVTLLMCSSSSLS